LRSRSARSLLTRAQHGYHVQVGLTTISASPPGGPDSLQTRLPSARSDATALRALPPSPCSSLRHAAIARRRHAATQSRARSDGYSSGAPLTSGAIASSLLKTFL